ncbi:DUF397 domain-containing protein [Streptomyces sp. NPDC046887]|uniref:DUF397 domain-containing protein n=1 Tax=Streptomyces sp. NPDC046887 TaxID=3155472 RepID=UPI0033C15AEC
MSSETSTDLPSAAWFKSSYSSSSDGEDCVEVAPRAWFKSSYSDSSDGEDCVEIAACTATVHVRDSKNIPGPQLGLAPTAWAAFIAYAAQA